MSDRFSQYPASMFLFKREFPTMLLRPCRFGDFFGSAHAGMTAEGDNSVLMQKVAKEHLALFKPHKLESISSVDLNKPEHIVHLLKLKENEQYNYLRNKIGKAMVFTKV